MTKKNLHKKIKSLDYTLINRQESLARLVRTLRNQEQIAVDLEADSMFHYREKACLIQISVGGNNFLVDPLARGIDLSVLAPVFKTRKTEKIFHGADYDIRCLFRDFSIDVNGLFDTQVAARFIGEVHTGLAPLLEKRFGVSLEKKYQKKNWSQRPLPPEMTAYAAGDTYYLFALAAELKKELIKKDRLFWAEEECAILSKVRPAPPNNGPMFLKFRGAGRLDLRSLAVLENILIFRDELAQKWDRPLFKVMGNRSILEMVREKPETVEGLSAVDGFSAKQAKIFGKGLARAIRQAVALPEQDLSAYPKKKRVTGNPKAPLRISAMKEWRNKKGDIFILDPSVILTNAQIQILAAKKPCSAKDLGMVPEIRKWQKKVFGKEIVDLLKTIP